ncbi:MAG: D-alanine--poly(phosphoribitol) ligase subunit DltA [Clostridiales bacterium]
MDILSKLKHYAQTQPQSIAMKTDTQTITYQELDMASDSLSVFLEKRCGKNKYPIAVYGHKSPFMLIAMVACVKSGRGYCPIDISVPNNRTQMILKQLDSPIILATENLNCDFKEIISLNQMKKIIETTEPISITENWVKGEDVFYIIFTSGSTGQPKGVEITVNCLNNFLHWSLGLGTAPQEKSKKVFLNQAPFSFDLSVMDIYTSLAAGGTLWSLTKTVQSDYKLLLTSLKESKIAIWVSTPSFVDICLTDKSFNSDLMPNLELFLFCGETLTNATAEKLQQRFPCAKIMNTYGPTESTVAMTEILITPEVNARENPLPVGMPKKGTTIEIRKPDGSLANEGEKGEIVIIGDTVSCGYYKQAEISQKVFFTPNHNQNQIRGYHTGDKGYLKNGNLYYCGRIDLQIKLHGYRIEIEDIENNISKIADVANAIVIPNVKNGAVKSLTAFIVYKKTIEDSFLISQKIKEELREFLPEYMIPKKIVFLDSMPLTDNAKANRQFLGGLSS